ncbi:MAG: amidohydrolase family protein [Alphaproteobacteria bacterium]
MADELRVCMPPDPNPKKPGYALPANSCDCHFHVFGPPHRFPLAATRRYTPPAAPIEHYFMMQKAVGLSRGIVVQPTAHGIDNSAVLDAVARGGGRLLGVANIDRSTSDEELARLQAGGIRGVRFSLMSDRAGATDDIAAAIPRIAPLGWSLDLHVEPAHLLAHEGFIRDIPVPVVIDHIGRVRPADGLDQPAMRLVLDLARDDDFWIKISCPDKISDVPEAVVDGGLPYADVTPFAQAAIDAAPDRILWGTDWPHANNFSPGRIPNDGDLLDLLAEFAPDEAVRNRILVDNPTRLYGF